MIFQIRMEDVKQKESFEPLTAACVSAESARTCDKSYIPKAESIRTHVFVDEIEGIKNRIPSVVAEAVLKAKCAMLKRSFNQKNENSTPTAAHKIEGILPSKFGKPKRLSKEQPI